MAYSLRTDKSWQTIESDIREQLSRWGAATYLLSRPNVAVAGAKPVRPATGAAAAYQTPEEATVVLQAKWDNGRELRLEYNKQSRAVDNARVLFLAIESLRLNEVRGIDDVMRAAYLALPPPVQPVKARDPYEVLGVLRGVPLADIEDLYRIKAKRLHPDTSAQDDTAMKELNVAMDAIRAERRAVAS